MEPETIYTCPNCWRSAPWTDGYDESDVAAGEAEEREFHCQTCGAETPIRLCPVQQPI